MDKDSSASEPRHRPPQAVLLIPVVAGSNLAGDTMKFLPPQGISGFVAFAFRPAIHLGVTQSRWMRSGPRDAIDGPSGESGDSS